jgi:DNA-binding MarR family transcriptional regulator
MPEITNEDHVDRIVQQWAQERPELETEAMAVFGRIYRIARLVGDQQTRVYAEHGITRGEFDVLATLRRSGSPYQLAPKALSASMMVTTGGMTGLLDRLERRSLIARSPDPVDRRGLLITLTETGRELVDGAVGAGLSAQREVLERLPAGRRRRLDELLKELLAAADAAEAGRPVSER